MATTPRFIPGANQDNTLRTVTQAYLSPVYAATLNFIPTEGKTLVKPGTLTGALTINIAVVSGTAFGTYPVGPFVGDEIEFIFVADASARTVTIGTGCASSAATLVVAASKYGSLKFKFNGVVWQETDRTITA